MSWEVCSLWLRAEWWCRSRTFSLRRRIYEAGHLPLCIPIAEWRSEILGSGLLVGMSDRIVMSWFRVLVTNGLRLL